MENWLKCQISPLVKNVKTNSPFQTVVICELTPDLTDLKEQELEDGLYRMAALLKSDSIVYSIDRVEGILAKFCAAEKGKNSDFKCLLFIDVMSSKCST